MSTHPQCFACRIRATRCHTFQKDAAPRTSRPWAGGIRTCAAPLVLCLPNMRQPLSHFPNRCHSSHRPAVAIKRSTRPLHGHQSASARGSRHRTSWAAGIRTGTSPPVPCLTAARQHLPHFFKQMPLLAPTGRRNQAVYSTSAPTPISLSSPIQAPHIMGRWNMH